MKFIAGYIGKNKDFKIVDIKEVKWMATMSTKCDMGAILTLEYLEEMYYKHHIAHIATDGKYVQIEKDLSAATEKVN